MTAKSMAIKDIKNDLKQEGRTFLSFHRELNPVMKELVREHIKEQNHLSFTLSVFGYEK